MGISMSVQKIVELANDINTIGNPRQVELDKQTIGVVFNVASTMRNMIDDKVFNLEIEGEKESFCNARLDDIIDEMLAEGDRCVEIETCLFTTDKWGNGDIEGTIGALKSSANTFAGHITILADAIAYRANVVQKQRIKDEKPAVQEMVDLFITMLDGAKLIAGYHNRGYVSRIIGEKLGRATCQLNHYKDDSVVIN